MYVYELDGLQDIIWHLSHEKHISQLSKVEYSQKSLATLMHILSTDSVGSLS